MSDKKQTTTGKKVHVIANTHWDRAWVYPFNETRLLLVEFMDNLLELLETDQKFHSFLLDSQTVAIEDYLEFRPERKEQIKKFVKNGRLIVGPWYNLPEEYIVNGESLVRNLVVGHRQAEELGKVSQKLVIHHFLMVKRLRCLKYTEDLILILSFSTEELIQKKQSLF